MSATQTPCNDAVRALLRRGTAPTVELIRRGNGEVPFYVNRKPMPLVGEIRDLDTGRCLLLGDGFTRGKGVRRPVIRDGVDYHVLLLRAPNPDEEVPDLGDGEGILAVEVLTPLAPGVYTTTGEVEFFRQI